MNSSSKKMPGQPPLVVREWKPDTVYLVQFPRAGCIPSASPFAVKLETWLRMTGIKYHNVSNEFTKMSHKGQIPFIEYNGRQIPDSNFIIQYLTKECAKEEMDSTTLGAHQAAEWRAFMYLLENSLFWGVVYNRSRNNSWFATEQGFIGHLSGIKKFAFKNFLLGQFKKRIAENVHRQGYGRHKPEEIEEIMCKDLDALSVLLGDKQFFFKEIPTSFDATAFGHLVQVLYTPMISTVVKDHMTSKCANLVSFCDRIKGRYWPDWDYSCEKLSLETTGEMPKPAEAAQES